RRPPSARRPRRAGSPGHDGRAARLRTQDPRSGRDRFARGRLAGFLDPPAGELPRVGSQAPGGLHRRAPADRCAARRGAVRPSRTSRAGPTVARPAVARPAVARPAVPRPALAQSSPPRPAATWPVPPRRGPTAAWPVPPRRGPTTTSPHRGVAPLRPGTSSVEFGGFGGRDTPANSTLEAAPEAMRRHTRGGTRSDAAPHSTRHQKRRATTLDPAPEATRNPTRGGTTVHA